MNDRDLERLLSAALDAEAQARVGDALPPPAPRFATAAEPSRRHRRVRVLAPLAAAAAVVAVVVAATSLGDSTHRPAPVAGGHGRVLSQPASTVPTVKHAPGAPVRIAFLERDGAQYGVGMPVVAYFSRKFTDARSLSAATTVAVNGKPVTAAWYFEPSTARRGYPVEGHLRLRGFWPAHSKVQITLAAKGVTGGPGFSFANAASLDFRTGASTIATVDNATHRLYLQVDGKKVGAYPVSLGAPQTPTSRGTKVIMAKGASICLSGPGYNECGVKDTQRLTYSGEYLHSAPWNVRHIKEGIDSSNGCTNLLPADANLLYKMTEVGDVVRYPDATGPQMTMGVGFADWDVPWSRWLTGGLIPTR